MIINSSLVQSPVRDVYIKGSSLLPLRLLRKMRKSSHINGRIVESPLVYRLLDSDAKKILDLGCYGSAIALSLASLGFEVTAIDLREYPFKHPNLKSIHGDFFYNNFSNNCFDAVTCISMLEHINSSKKRFMQEILRVLKKGGQCLLSFPTKVPSSDFIPKEKIPELLQGFKVRRKIVFHKNQNVWICVESHADSESAVVFYDLKKK